MRNRLWVPPMCMYSALGREGLATDWHLVHYGTLAKGGAGLVVLEATGVLPEGRISMHDLGLWNDAQRDALRPIAEFISSQGAVPGIQLGHAGRKGSTYPGWGFEGKAGTMPASEGGWHTVAPSGVAFDGLDVPHELSHDQIETVIEGFASAAHRAAEAGFKVIELHAAHGYLLHQFLSPLSNQRTDEYGDALANRARILLEIVRRSRAAIGEEIALLVRFSATDWVDGGWNEEETSIVADWCGEAGADFFDISSGGNVSTANIPLGPGYQVPLAHYVKQHAHSGTSAVGLITEAHQANDIITQGRADAVMIGRESLRNPYFPLDAAVALGVEIDYWPSQYLRAKPAPQA
jgi:2,4-dienoyl-CoA reductase-like NADH-dependent reductase (Old Yellow Enzyme family)